MAQNRERSWQDREQQQGGGSGHRGGWQGGEDFGQGERGQHHGAEQQQGRGSWGEGREGFGSGQGGWQGSGWQGGNYGQQQGSEWGRMGRYGEEGWQGGGQGRYGSQQGGNYGMDRDYGQSGWRGGSEGQGMGRPFVGESSYGGSRSGNWGGGQGGYGSSGGFGGYGSFGRGGSGMGQGGYGSSYGGSYGQQQGGRGFWDALRRLHRARPAAWRSARSPGRAGRSVDTGSRDVRRGRARSPPVPRARPRSGLSLPPASPFVSSPRHWTMLPPFSGALRSMRRNVCEVGWFHGVPELRWSHAVSGCMHLVRFYLPVRDNAGQAFPVAMFRAIEAELSQRFGGVTAHLASPASGLWRESGTLHADEVVIFEVLTEDVDRSWWAGYRARLARDFRQKQILLMLHAVEVV